MTLKRYVVFSYDKYYPLGGWKDLHSSHGTEEEAVCEAQRIVVYGRDLGYDRSHVVDTETGIYIGEYNNGLYL